MAKTRVFINGTLTDTGTHYAPDEVLGEGDRGLLIRFQFQGLDTVAGDEGTLTLERIDPVLPDAPELWKVTVDDNDMHCFILYPEAPPSVEDVSWGDGVEFHFMVLPAQYHLRLNMTVDTTPPEPIITYEPLH